MEKIIIYTDGGSRGNPGPAASGFIIFDQNNNILVKGGKYLGVGTNNEAEYQALILALEKVKEGVVAQEIEVRADSKLVVEQLNGNFKVKNSRIKVLYEIVKGLEQGLARVSYHHIPRSENFLADEIVNVILDSQNH